MRSFLRQKSDSVENYTGPTGYSGLFSRRFHRKSDVRSHRVRSHRRHSPRRRLDPAPVTPTDIDPAARSRVPKPDVRKPDESSHPVQLVYARVRAPSHSRSSSLSLSLSLSRTHPLPPLPPPFCPFVLLLVSRSTANGRDERPGGPGLLHHVPAVSAVPEGPDAHHDDRAGPTGGVRVRVRGGQAAGRCSARMGRLSGPIPGQVQRDL